ncbi:MAG: hypothetical protein P4L91_10445 [Burkholderiaceae bacterium]|nr:hypothetical protein [Burkholderiaceae bacterium]
MIFFMPMILLWLGAGIGWLTYSRVMRRQAEIRQVSPEYAAQLFRTNLASTLFFRGYLRVTTLLFMSPPDQLKDMMFPMRKMMAVSIFVSVVGLGLFWLRSR